MPSDYEYLPVLMVGIAGINMVHLLDQSLDASLTWVTAYDLGFDVLLTIFASRNGDPH
ncbi:hypothetical protein ICN18_08400 [Polynucleobacter sp. Ross1-W9]|uniref:hypothetical protein n=1 Tax=Polynucleobacter parvulilacunae TaxID=1855631 RepID=UPI001C0C4C5A|nr:hypothetical protein [Polynucleobacter parvulilacunae]MBU3557647.1 hypothetical protein [Polynucleobacter parvulilacunae]